MSTTTVSSSSDSAQVQATKTRIINHMNADHADSLSLFLQHYAGVPAVSASTAKMTDITTDHIIVESRAGRILIPLEPPMKSLSEARERMVAMQKTALKGLGLSEIKIAEFALPNRVWQWGVFFACLLCFVTFPFPEQIRPETGSWAARAWSFGGLVPGLASLASQLGGKILPAMIAIHLGETTYMWWSRIRKHRVPTGSVAWWLWVASTFISGGATIKRFDELVLSKEQKAKAGKH